MKYYVFSVFIACGLLIVSPCTAQLIPQKKPLVGIFDGRTPCQELAGMIQETTTPECTKIKWRLALYKDSVTGKPNGYQLWGLIYRNERPREGQWQIVRGTKADPDAIVYRLDLEGKPSLFLQKGDDNVLFFLDAAKKLLVGNRDFSYTLNRVSKANEMRIMATAK
jgi:hypothetical protein